jgi:hypothetical protein
MGYKLFQPSDIDMIRDYPELKEYKEFVNMKNDELRFAWEFGNPTSETAKIEDIQQKRKVAYEKVYGNTKDTRQVQFLMGDFPDTVRAAIEKMKSFKPSARMRAKMMTENTFNNFETIMNKDLSGFDDVDEIKKYTELKLKISAELPALIKQMEAGFGIKEVDAKGKEVRVPTYADGLHDAISRSN